MSTWCIRHGDLLDVLPTMADASIDACVTDPPYELGFMGKSWDSSGVAYQPETWRQIHRVLKPGAHLLAFSGTRTFHRVTVAIEDAGFEIRDCLSWLYGQGFPKSLDVSKAIDKSAGAAAKQWDGWGTALKPGWEPIIVARKRFKGSVAQNVLAHGTGAINIDACRLDGVPPSVPQPAIGANSDGRTYGFKTGEGCSGEMSQSDMGRWPANVLLDEEAAAMLDEQSGECKSAGEYRDPLPSKGRRKIYAETFKEGWKQFTGGYWAEIITPEETFPVRPDGSLCEPVRHRERKVVVDYGNKANRNNNYANETGGASRFYYVAKPSRSERDAGCYDSPRNGGLDPRGNFHPTVKPVDLMRWLVRLVTPIGGTVLDPFTGSGTTGMACIEEQCHFVGIEREADYIEIARRRIGSVAPLLSRESRLDSSVDVNA